MEYNEVKRVLTGCPDLAALDDASAADLFWRADEITYAEGDVIYAEGRPLDHTFCLLLSGELSAEKDGMITGTISERQIFGEMAYFTNQSVRNASVRVSSPQAVILQFHLTPAELGSPQLSGLRRCLFLRTWNRFVSTSQSGSPELLAMSE
jgi:hypothetical protein